MSDFYGKCYFHVVWNPPGLEIVKVIRLLRISGAKDSGKVFIIMIYFYWFFGFFLL